MYAQRDYVPAAEVELGRTRGKGREEEKDSRDYYSPICKLKLHEASQAI